jgi:predicted DNA-binding antitoxin AbrB/MazE fold protein
MGFFSLAKRKERRRMTMRAVRMRVRDGRLEPLEDVALREGSEVVVGIEVPEAEATSVTDALRESAGAWSDEAHPELKTREDVVEFVRTLRAGFERPL